MLRVVTCANWTHKPALSESLTQWPGTRLGNLVPKPTLSVLISILTDTYAHEEKLLPVEFSLLSWVLFIDVLAGSGTGSNKLVSQLPGCLLGGGDDGITADVISGDDIIVAIAADASVPPVTVSERRTAT